MITDILQHIAKTTRERRDRVGKLETCYICKNTYENTISSDEQEAEAKFMFGDRAEKENMVLLCDSCLTQIYPDYFCNGGKS